MKASPKTKVACAANCSRTSSSASTTPSAPRMRSAASGDSVTGRPTTFWKSPRTVRTSATSASTMPSFARRCSRESRSHHCATLAAGSPKARSKRIAVGTVGGDEGLYTFDNDTGPDDANHAQHGMFILRAPGVEPVARVSRAQASMVDAVRPASR